MFFWSQSCSFLPPFLFLYHKRLNSDHFTKYLCTRWSNCVKIRSHHTVTLVSDIMCSLWITVRRYLSAFFFFFRDMGLNFPEPHRDKDGWHSAKERAAEFWTRACLGGPIVQGPLSVYPRLCLSPMIRTFHWCTKRLFVTIVSSALRRAAKYNRFKNKGVNKFMWLDTEKRKQTKMRDYLFFSSAMITVGYSKGSVSQHS